MDQRRIRFFAFDFQGPSHLSAGLWRHPDDQAFRYNDVHYWTDYAKLLEQGRFDGIFLADNVGYHDVYQGSVDEALRDAAQIPANDPTLLVSAMAAATKNLTFGITASTAYEQPYSLARRFTTLDHLTDGRIGWNLVTSYADSAARNLGSGTQTPHDERYDMAAEYLQVCFKLWEYSWQDDAVRKDRVNSVYVDPSRVHPIEHTGRYFTVPGIFLCEPSIQRTPVIFQAGGSSKGVALAASSAEAVFVNATSYQALKKQVDNLREKAALAGRDPESVKVIQMVTVISGRTDEEAQQKYAEYLKLVSYSGAMARYSGWTGLDMSTFDPDVPFKYVKTNAGQTMVDVFVKMDPDKDWTPRDIADYIGIGGTSPVIVGSPSTVADELQKWMELTGIDGFNLTHAVKHKDVADFIELVVPELQRRGQMWSDYDGSTMREKLYGRGQTRLLDDHPGAQYRRLTASPANVG